MASILNPYQLGIAGKGGEFRYFGENPDRFDLENPRLYIDNASKHRDIIVEVSESGNHVATVFVKLQTVAEVPLKGYLSATYLVGLPSQLDLVIKCYRLAEYSEEGVEVVNMINYPGPLWRAAEPNLVSEYILRLPTAVPA